MSVQSIADLKPKTNTTLNQNAPISYALKFETPVFGGPPAFASIAGHQFQTSQSIFGDNSFGSNMPTFQRPFNLIDHDSECLRVDRTTSTPNILKAVGLCRIPKTYSKKSLTLNETNQSDTTCQMIFCMNANFGRIDYEL